MVSITAQWTEGKLERELVLLDQFSLECRKTKTKVISQANHNTSRQANELIRTRGKYI